MPFLFTNNINIHYEIIGNGPPLLFIHGLGGSFKDWEKQVAFFEKEYQIILCDLRGHGKTDKPEAPYSVPLFTQDIASFLKTLAVDQAHVVGHSLGGMISFQLALDYPKLVKSLTIINSSPAVIFPDFKTQFKFQLRGLNIKLFGMKPFSIGCAKSLFPKPEQEKIREIFIQRWCENSPKAYINALHAFKGWNVIHRLSEIQCPTLIVTADNDYTTVNYKEAYTRLIPNAKLVVIKDSRHATTWDQPKALNKVIGEFLV